MGVHYKVFFFICFLFGLNSILFSQSSDTLNLYFGINESEVSIQQQKILDDLLVIENIDNIKILGYADFLGTIEFNNQLSEKRSINAKNYLLSKGIDKNKIFICSGQGIHKDSKIENKIDNSDRGIKEHRKVEIIYSVIKDNENKIEEEAVVIPVFGNLNKENLVVGNNIILDNILFKGGSSVLLSESEFALRQLIAVMKSNPTLIIEIQGHICCQNDGKDGYDYRNKNNNLSVNRAKAVYDYLLKNGIEEERMTYVGYGSEFKLYPDEKNECEENMNRRVEIFIYGI